MSKILAGAVLALGLAFSPVIAQACPAHASHATTAETAAPVQTAEAPASTLTR